MARREERTTPSGVVFAAPREPAALLIGLPDGELEKILTGVSCRPQHVTDVTAALDWLAKDHPDLLLLDAGMPMALELVRDLKARALSSALPVIAVSRAKHAARERERAYAVGCDHWMARPLAAEELRQRVQHLLRSRGLLRSLLDSHDQLRMRRDWVRYLVHDIRGPLAVASGNLELLAESATGETAAAVADARHELDRIGGLLQDLLDVDRIQKGEIVLRPVPFDVARMLERIETRAQTLTRSAKLAVEVKSARIDLVADKTMIERLVQNLFNNALRYARKRVVLAAEQHKGIATIRVLNDGPAIPGDMREQVFVPFVRLGEGAGGAGLGLAFARLAARAHGGDLVLEDVRDGLVCFTVTLPVAFTRQR